MMTADVMEFRASIDPVCQPTEFSCMAAVAAMITGDAIEDVFRYAGHDGAERPFRFLEIASYLNTRGFHLGAFARSSLWLMVPGEQPALLIVRSMSGTGPHAVLWTGECILDPERANSVKRLDDYRVLEWWPVTRYEG